MWEARDVSLCGTCRYTPGCALRRDRSSPVFHCEEFEVEGAQLPEAEGRGRPAPNPSGGHNPTGGGNPRYRGLCTDCENQASCMFVESEGGVWHCEEYR